MNRDSRIHTWLASHEEVKIKEGVRGAAMRRVDKITGQRMRDGMHDDLKVLSRTDQIIYLECFRKHMEERIRLAFSTYNGAKIEEVLK